MGIPQASAARGCGIGNQLDGVAAPDVPDPAPVPAEVLLPPVEPELGVEVDVPADSLELLAVLLEVDDDEPPRESVR